MKKLAIIIILLILPVGLYLAFRPNSETETEVRYITVSAEKGDLRSEITCTGTLRPVVEVLVGSQVSGTIKQLYADFESTVTKGQLIAMIDPDLFEAKAAQARADLAAAKAALAKAEVTYEDEVRNLKRKESLLAAKSISQSEFDSVKTRTDAAEAQVAVDKARVVQMEAKLSEAELQLKYSRIETPVNGVVTLRNVDVGQTVAASFQAPVMFKIAEDLKTMQVNTNVDEADIGRVKEGQKASFTVPAFPEETFPAEVRQIRNEPKIEQNVVTYNVVLDVDNKDLRLRPGMTANVTILLEEARDALTVPDQAFRFTPPVKAGKGADLTKLSALQPGQKRLWLLKPDNTIRPVTVKTGIAGAQQVQVFSDQLKPGDKLVVEAVIRAEKSRTRVRGLRF